MGVNRCFFFEVSQKSQSCSGISSFSLRSLQIKLIFGSSSIPFLTKRLLFLKVSSFLRVTSCFFWGPVSFPSSATTLPIPKSALGDSSARGTRSGSRQEGLRCLHRCPNSSGRKGAIASDGEGVSFFFFEETLKSFLTLKELIWFCKMSVSRVFQKLSSCQASIRIHSIPNIRVLDSSGRQASHAGQLVFWI